MQIFSGRVIINLSMQAEKRKPRTADCSQKAAYTRFSIRVLRLGVPDSIGIQKSARKVRRKIVKWKRMLKREKR